MSTKTVEAAKVTANLPERTTISSPMDRSEWAAAKANFESKTSTNCVTDRKGEGRISSLIDSILSRNPPPRVTESTDPHDIRIIKRLKNRCVLYDYINVIYFLFV